MGDVVALRPDRPTIVEQADRPLREARAHLIQTVDDAAELLRWLSERGREEIALDTETTGINRQKDRIRLVQIGDEMDGWVIPFERWGGVVEDIVNRYQGDYDMHNAPFDWTMLANEGIMIPTDKIHDTRLMAHVLSSTGPLGLKPLSQRHIDPAAAAAQEALRTGIGTHGGWTWGTVPVTFEPYWVYAALDAVLTKRLKNGLWPRVQADAPNSYWLERMVMWVCVKMERKGARIDREYTRQFRDQLASHAQATEQWCKDHFNVAPGSRRVADVLISEGVRLTTKTKTGYSLDKYVLGEIDHPLAQAVLGHRQSTKLVSTYLDTYLELTETGDGRIHPSINTVGGTDKNPFESGGGRGVRTSRMSMDSPNLQNVPKHTNVGSKIRNCFVPDDGNTWIKCDADQIEMRIFAHLTEDPALIDSFHQAKRTGVDMFTTSARDIFQCPDLIKSDERRQHTKNGFYSIIYGAGTEKFAKTAGIMHETLDWFQDQYGNPFPKLTKSPDLGAASSFLQRLHGMYPGIRDLQNKLNQEALIRQQSEGIAYVRSALTNRRLTADPDRIYALLNYKVQGMAGEVLKMKIVEADHAGLSEYMMFPVHDEIDLDVPNDQVGDVLRTLDEVMNDDKLFSVPITWSADHGKRWGECE